MFGWLTKLRRRRILARHPIADDLWRSSVAGLPFLDGLSAPERVRLRHLCTVFLAEKRFVGAADLRVDDGMCVAVAVQACLPILNLSMDWYRHWVTLILYPGPFVARHEWEDDDGVVHRSTDVLEGEAWSGGPVVLNWQQVREPDDAALVVVHEMAHKLDDLDGSCNGLPPLHRHMSVATWSATFNAAFDDFNKRCDRGEKVDIDPYAAQDPGEFFAVTSEYFFSAPEILHHSYPAVYRLLSDFYRQDTLARRKRGKPRASGL